MGNVSETLFKEYEATTGAKLLKGIQSNEKKLVVEAIDLARKQLMTPNMNKTHKDDHSNMVIQMTAYLTRKYDVGEGLFFKKTPLEYAEAIGSSETIEYITETIKNLAKHDQNKVINNEKSPAISSAVGTIDKERVALAKSRLQYMRNKEKDKNQS
jgi:hypothetical protein